MIERKDNIRKLKLDTSLDLESNELLDSFARTCRNLLIREAVPNHQRWEQEGLIDRRFWLELGATGLLGLNIDKKYGGGGIKSYEFQQVIIHELIQFNLTVPGIVAHNDVLASYLATYGTEAQNSRLLPDLCAGKKIAAIAITESHTGSDLTAIKTTARTYDENHFVLNGEKSFITNGFHADVVVVAAKLPEDGLADALSLFIVERGMVGFERSQPFHKIGWHASDTSSLYFDECIVPKTNLLGKKHLGNMYFMTAMCRERLSIATVAVCTAEKMLSETMNYVKERRVFGYQIGQLQHNKFVLAEISTELKVAKLFLENAISKFNQNQLSLVDSAQLKWYCTELQNKIADCCLQLHGGMGYMRESSISRDWINSRVQKIYGGSSEVMLEIIGKSLGL